MEVVGQVLVVRIGMHRFKMATNNLILVVHGLEYGNDCVCCAGCSAESTVALGNLAIIYPVNDVLDGALPRSGQQNPLHTR